MPKHIHAYTYRAILLLVLATVLSSQAFAQRRGGSETDLLKREDIQAQLELSEDQTTKLTQLQDQSSTSREVFSQFADRLRSAETEEERNKIRQELQAAVAKANSAFEDNAATVLNDQQKQKLRGLYLQNAGTRALDDEKIAAEFGLTDEQKQKIASLSEERRTASRDLGFEATDEQRDEFNEQWTNKILAVLTPEQKAQWDKQLAVVATAAQDNVGSVVAGPQAVPGPGRPMQPPPGASVSASFGAIPGDRSQRVESFTFNFRYAPWDQVLQMFADGAGLTLDLVHVPPGTFSHFDDNSYTTKQALDVMNGYLLRQGYAMVQKDNFLVVMKIDSPGIPPSLIPSRTLEELTKVGQEIVIGDNELARVSIPIENMETGRAAQEVEALLGPQGSMVALTESRLLIVTDIGANLRQIHSLLTSAMSKSKPDDLTFKSYYLKNIDADEAEIQLLTLFGMSQGAVNVSYGAGGDRDRGRGPAPQQTPTPAAGLLVSSELRTNSLFVTGTEKQHALVEQILKALDVSEGPGGEALSGRGKRGTYLEVYQVTSADAGEVAKTLSAMNMPGVTVVNEDRRNGKLHIMASERQHQEVAQLVRQLDGTGGSESVAVIQLARMDPLSAAATLRSLFIADGDNAPTIETDLYGRRLIVRGSFDQITQIKTVLAELGEDGSGTRPASAGGPIRRYSLQGRSADEFLDLLKQAWQSTEPNPIRIEIPSQQGPIQGLETPDGPVNSGRNADPAPSQEQTQRQPADDVQPRNDPYLAVAVAGNGFQQDALTADDAAASDAPQPSDSPQVLITVIGEELVLSSSDEQALDRLEELLDSLQQSLPYRTTWTVFYLRTADATEAADMLAQIFPSSSVSTTTASTGGSFLGGLGSSFSSLGDSVMDATGLSGLGSSPMTLQIIPDVRSNSLFISGTDSMLRDVREVLRVLDSNDIPDSLRDMQPRSIVVEHGDVDQIAGIIRDIYKPLMEAQGGDRRQQQQNPFAALMGGGRGGDESQQIRMTLGVDRNTSTLIVSSSADVFAGVQELVQNLDESARTANRMIRVVPLKHADASQIQQSLSSLLPRVSVSTSRTSGGSSGGSGNTSPAAPGSSNNNDDAAAQAFRDQMRARFGGGGDGGRPSFGGFGGGGGGRPSFGGGGGFPGLNRGGGGRSGGRR